VREPRHLHIRILQQVGDVVGGGLPVDRRVEREDHLGHRRIVRARDQRIDGEVLRADAVERRQRAAEHVIARVDGMRALERPQVGDVGDHHDDRGLAARVGAHRARVLGVDVAAGPADLDLLERGCERLPERRHDLLALLDQKERSAARRARPEPGQARQQLDQAFDFGTGDGGGHGWEVIRTTSSRAAAAARR
jgi:hypothetical protein